MTFTDGSSIVYSYAADGAKLRTVHNINGTTTQKDYCGSVIYENGAAKLWQTEAGYISMNDSKYHYYLQDHQGNNRVVVSETGATEEVNHYYAFGGLFDNSNSVQPFKYNGKELDTHKGLNWYDYGARQYDATLGRWFAVDPLAEKMYGWSLYAYCFNNPVKFVDENGEIPRIYVETKGLGHTFVTTGTGKNTIVYTYGRYGALNGNKSSARSFSRNGEGVLIIMQGDEAINYIKDEVLLKEAKVYEITNANDDKVNAFFYELFNASEIHPSKGKYKNNENAKVIDTYDLWNNNCTTKSIEAINMGTEGDFDIESFSPANIDTQLHYKSKNNNSNIIKVLINKIIEEYGMYKK